MTLAEVIESLKTKKVEAEVIAGSIEMFSLSMSTWSFVLRLVVTLDNGCIWPLTIETRQDHAGAVLTLIMTAAGLLPSDEPRPESWLSGRRVRMVFGKPKGKSHPVDCYTYMGTSDEGEFVSMDKLEEQAADLARKRLEEPWVLRPLPKVSDAKEENANG